MLRRRKHTKQRAKKSRTRRVPAPYIGYPPVGLLPGAHTNDNAIVSDIYVVTVNLGKGWGRWGGER